MQKEIGSEYWIISSIKDYKKNIPEWLDKWNNLILTSSGRGAINLVIDSIKNKVKNKTALLPAYCCHSMIDPFLINGFQVYFYDIEKKNLKPNIDSIRKFLNNDIGILLHMGYYGFSSNINLDEIFAEFKKGGTFIVENITHTLFSEYKRSISNDFFVGSIRKWFGIPSGGLFSSNKKIYTKQLKEDYLFCSIRKIALELKGKYITFDNNLKPQFLDLFRTAEKILDRDSGTYSIDKDSISILNEINIEELKTKRRENYQYLLKEQKNLPYIEIIFKELPKDVCPLFFPIYVQDIRDSIQNKLIKNMIYTPVHWPRPSLVSLKNKGLRYIYDNILSIPCDQRYGLIEMKKIVDFLKSFSKNI